MGIPAIGTVLVVNFPYADFSRLKRRPCLVVGYAEFGNLIVCQITSRASTSKTALAIAPSDLDTQGLQSVSFARPDKLVTLEARLIIRILGRLNAGKTTQIIHAVRQLFDEPAGDNG